MKALKQSFQITLGMLTTYAKIAECIFLHMKKAVECTKSVVQTTLKMIIFQNDT